MIIGGTPKGKGVFHELASRGKDKLRNPDWHTFDPPFTSYDNPLIPRAQIDELAATMPELVRRQEIFAEFLDDVASVFRNLRECMTAAPADPVKGATYYAGVDVAKHVDFTVICILDAQGRQVYHARFNQLDWGYQKKFIIEACRRYDARVLIDSTGVGDAIYDDLRTSGLRIEGLVFTPASKKRIVESLMLAFENRSIAIFADNPIQEDELKLFSYDISSSGNVHYSAPDGYHDDCVMALALAWWCKDKSAVRVPRFASL
jgi:phage FluMu gp28-like protein